MEAAPAASIRSIADLLILTDEALLDKAARACRAAEFINLVGKET